MDTWISILLGAAGLLAAVPALLWLYSRTLPRPDRAFLGFRNALARLVEHRLGGYRHPHTVPDPHAPERVEGAMRVAVIGGGLGGIGAATTLAERGADVVIFEKNPYFGGKIAAWEDVTSDGSIQKVAHGFHAFFRNYYNLNAFLRRIGVHQQFTSLDDYQVLSADGVVHSYRDIDTAPVLNLVSLGDHGVFSWSDIVFSQAIHEMDRFLLYDEAETFAQLDHVPFDRFAERAELPRSLMLSFNSFSRAFFADPDRLSTAELIKSFHFYYLSQDAGLIYDLPADWFGDALIAPIVAHLEQHGVDIRLATPVTTIERPQGGARFVVNGEGFDAVVLATDVGGTAKLAAGRWLDDAETTARQLRGVKAGQRYCVIRQWLDGDVRDDIASYLVVDRQRALDAVALLHRFERTFEAWHEQTGGSVIELHCYALPDDLPDDEVRDVMVAELHRFFPEAAERDVITEHVQIRADFPAFHTGLYADRPQTETEVPGLVVAGDWVRLPFPATLMEGAFTSGVLAANALLRERGVQEAPVDRVPTQGVMVGLPEPPGKRRVSFD